METGGGLAIVIGITLKEWEGGARRCADLGLGVREEPVFEY